ncbi:ATP-binding protein [Amycolatopsis vancoresmycina]|uniref:STAS domain-containing protein n=1 Tax=Amycolatopsis vancoresmycina DSM 44592 TaxID=1292037 RepID=R1G2V6_9PSEU|nr:ATP-binding protein [Amycolatopsis vancoresmycina]EOD65797.1 hypothetical protein H480_24807 [Amycolatopsis vancoresmycina DSM 44592]
MRRPLELDVTSQARFALVTAQGGLHLGSYRRLRDGLLEVAADTPDAVIARIDGLDFDGFAPLSVFGLVARRLGTWPGIPFALATGTEDQARTLREQGVHRRVAIQGDVPSAERALCRPARRQLELPLHRDPEAPALARTAVREACARWSVPHFVYDGILVAGELAENTLRHTGSAITLRLDLRRDRLTIAVLDDDPRPAVLLPRPTPGASGLGLHIVAQSAAEWGCSPRWSGGKVVWAVLTSEGRPG